MEECNRIKSPQQSTHNTQDISLSYSKYRGQEKCGSQGKKTISGDDLKVTQILEFSDEDDFTAAVTGLNEIKVNTLQMNNKIGDPGREVESIQTKHGHSKTVKYNTHNKSFSRSANQQMTKM